MKIVADENMPLLDRCFARHGSLVTVPGREISAELVEDADLLLVRSVTQVDEQLISRARRLKFIGSATIGTDHIDCAALEQRGIAFASAPGCNAEAVVDYTLAAIWNVCARLNRDPSALRCGVVGCGAVGSRLVGRLERLGISVKMSDPPRALRDPDFVNTDLDELIAESDLISLHTPLTREGQNATYHLLNKNRIDALKADALLINAGRGAVIDQKALQDRLERGPALHAILDVWEQEPQVSHLFASKVALATPHIAGYSLDGKIRGTWMLYKALCAYLGETAELSLESLLPDPPISELESGGNLNPIGVMSLVYDIEADDQRFRESLDMPDQAARFDLLRRHYPLRREFSSLQVKGLSVEQQQLFSGLGFGIAREGV